jgi:hypothetical protein
MVLLVQQSLGRDLFVGDVYLFRGRRDSLIKGRLRMKASPFSGH